MHGKRKSDLFFGVVILQAFLLGLIIIYSLLREKTDMPGILERARLVKELELTDLCLFSDARYTRHVSQADLHSPFQDYPMSFEHFPSGSLLPPPYHLSHGRLQTMLRTAR